MADRDNDTEARGAALARLLRNIGTLQRGDEVTISRKLLLKIEQYLSQH